MTTCNPETCAYYATREPIADAGIASEGLTPFSSQEKKLARTFIAFLCNITKDEATKAGFTCPTEYLNANREAADHLMGIVDEAAEIVEKEHHA